MKTSSYFVATALLALGASGCGYQTAPTEPFAKSKVVDNENKNVYVVRHREETVFEIEAQKWHDGHRSAIAMTYDAPWGFSRADMATDAVLARGLRMDLEIVTSTFRSAKGQRFVRQIREELIPQGIHTFGHGHTHAFHDELDFDSALTSFRRNFDLMSQWGLNPKAYAYPNSSGRKVRTQLANKEAGFICARGAAVDPEDFHICPGDVREPENWYYLPSAVMGTQGGNIPTHAHLRPSLVRSLELGSWIILMYHAIDAPEGWGYYPLEEFERDLEFIAAHDFWSGNMDDIACYIQERNALDISVVGFFGSETPKEYEMVVKDGLDNAVYDQPLTLDFTFRPQWEVERILFDPPIAGTSSYEVIDNRLRLYMVPDEQRYTVILE